MKELYIEIASCIIRIEFLPLKKSELYHDNKRQRMIFIKQVIAYLSKFIRPNVPENIDFTISVEGEHITFIHNSKFSIVSIPLFKKISENNIQTYDYINIIQFQMLLRDITSRLLIQKKGCVVHASALEKNGKAYLFLGQSGTGKSTMVRLLKNVYFPIVDDLVFLRKEGTNYYLYQTPFIEKQWWINKENKKYQIESLFFIQKSKKTSLEKISDTTELLPFWLDQNLVSDENKEEVVKWSIKFVKSNVMFYKLYFRKRRKELEQLLIQ